jgi:hypothetical protein
MAGLAVLVGTALLMACFRQPSLAPFGGCLISAGSSGRLDQQRWRRLWTWLPAGVEIAIEHRGSRLASVD